MGRKKNLKGVDEADLEIIKQKMGYDVIDRCDKLFVYQEYDYKVNIKCKNKKQKEFLNLLKDDSKQICFGIGSAGSGKSYISLAYALQAVRDMSTPYKKIICLVPTCEGA